MENKQIKGSIESSNVTKNKKLINGSYDQILEVASTNPNISENLLLQYAIKSANATLPKGLTAKVADAEQCYFKDEDGMRMQIGFDLFNK